MVHHNSAECLRIVPIIVKNGTRSLACPKAQGKRKSTTPPLVISMPNQNHNRCSASETD